MPGYYLSSTVIDGVSYPVASHFTRPGIYQQRSFVCSQCHMEYRRDQVRFYKGRVFGVPCGDYTDIYQLERRERDAVWKGSMSNGTRQEDF